MEPSNSVSMNDRYYDKKVRKIQRSGTVQTRGGTWTETGYRTRNTPWKENIAKKMRVGFGFGSMLAINGRGACRMQRPQGVETGFVINALLIRVKILI